MPLRRALSLLAVAVLACACSTVSGPEAKALVQQGALLLDVRSPEEFAEGHVAGAVNIPVDALPERLAEVEPKARPVVVYCRSGARSKKARAAARARLDEGGEPGRPGQLAEGLRCAPWR